MKKRLFFIGALVVIFSDASAQQQERESTIEEVSVASKIGAQRDQIGKNVTLLTSEDLVKFQGQSLSEVLQQTVGFQITGSHSANQEPKSPKIRGGKTANLLILIDGVPLKDVTGNDYTAADLRLISMDSVEKIEILNGASSVLYGSNATVSVINIITKKGANVPFGGQVQLKGGTFGTFGQNLQVGGGKNGFSYFVSGSNEKSDGISSAQGEDFDLDGYEKQSLYAKLGYAKDLFSVGVNTGYNHHLFSYDQGAFTDGTNRGDDQQFFVGANAKLKHKSGEFVLNARYSTSDRLIQDKVDGSYQDQYFYEGANFFSELYHYQKVSDIFRWTLGVSYENQQMGSKSLPWDGTQMVEDLIKKETDVSNFDVFAQANFSFDKLHLDLGARLTNHSEFGNHVVYNINPFYLADIGNQYLKVGYSFATAFISPTLYQLYGTLPYTLPNFDLKPEKNSSHSVDLEFASKSNTFILQASLFLRNEKDVFAYQTNPDFTGNFINVDENKVKGFEFGGNVRFIEKFTLGANYSFVEKENENTRLRQPKHRINSFLQFDPTKGTSIALMHQMIGKRSDSYWDNSKGGVENVELDSYNLFSLNINQQILQKFNAFVTVGNLFNTPYVDLAGYSHKKRNLLIGGKFNF